MKFAIVLFALAAVASAEYTRMFFEDCGSRQVDFYDMDIQPMPIVQPGNVDISFRADLKRDLVGGLQTELNIVRSVSGIKLPIRCYVAGGVQVGSCKYTDLCKILETLLPHAFNPQVCPPELLPSGIDCTCPLKIKKGLINIDKVPLVVPDASQTIATFLASGDFDIQIKLADDAGSISCVKIGFSVRPRK